MPILFCLFFFIAVCHAQSPTPKQTYLDIFNAEFLFDNIQVKEDKYWCLHKIVYRQPAATTQAQLPQGRKLQQIEVADAGSYQNSMANFLCSNDSLKFTDNNRVCQKIAQKVGQKYLQFFMSTHFRKKFSDVINREFDQLARNGRAPSQYRMKRSSFLERLDKALVKAMNDMMRNTLTRADMLSAKKNNISFKTLQYVILNVEHLYIQDREAAIIAYMAAFPSHSKICSGHDFSTKAVRRWIEAIELRFKPYKRREDPDKAELGIPESEKKDVPEDRPPQQEIIEKPPVFQSFPEIVESPKVNKIHAPVSKKGDAPNINEEKPEIEEPSTSTPSVEKNKKPKFGEIVEKPKKPVKKGPTPTKDRQHRVEIIEIQRSYNIEQLLLSFNTLTQSMKQEIQKCELNLIPAIARCEKTHGKDNCEKLTPTMVGPKCPKDTVRQGCCTCAPTCPENFKDLGLYCQKPKTYLIRPRQEKEQCYLANAKECEKVGDVWTPKCNPGFKRVGSSICVPACPAAMEDLGSKCQKKALKKVGHPFPWAAGDE